MSGTSLDGVDIAHCTFKKNKNWTYKIDKAKTVEYPSRLKKKLKSCFELSGYKLIKLDHNLGEFIGLEINYNFANSWNIYSFIISQLDTSYIGGGLGTISAFGIKGDFKLFNNNLDWPPPSNIKPIFISFHINNKDMLKDCYIPYYKLQEPIGCRDRSTAQYLANKGVNSYFSGCLTLTLDNIHKSQKGNAEYNVDIPSTDRSKYITHQKRTYASMNYVRRIPIAQRLLDGYASAKLVTTNRVHVMLPCLAYGTKVNFIIKFQLKKANQMD